MCHAPALHLACIHLHIREAHRGLLLMIEISAASCAVDRGLCLLVLIFQPRGRQLGSRPFFFNYMDFFRATWSSQKLQWKFHRCLICPPLQTRTAFSIVTAPPQWCLCCKPELTRHRPEPRQPLEPNCSNFRMEITHHKVVLKVFFLLNENI